MEEENEGPVKIPILLTSSAVMQGPGPGAYDTRGSIDRIAPIKIKGRYQEKVDSSAPPYVMLPSTIGSGRKCVFSGRPKDTAIETTPGPCFAPPAFGSDVPGCKIAHRTEDTRKEITPGPSDYDTTRREKIKGGSFHGPHERSLAVTSTSPGPGAYAVNTDYLYHSPRMPIGSRHYDRTTSDGPGPGEYDTRISAIKAKKYGGYIGNRTEIKSTVVTPGPSDYATNTDILKSVPKLHISGRPKVKDYTSSPGPYNTPSTFGSGPKYSMRSRPRDSAADVTPGVNYCPPDFGKDTPGAHIAGRYEKRLGNDVTPGPSDYVTNTSLVNLKKASVFHGVSDRSMAVRNTSPGPAAYSPRMPNTSQRIRIKGSSTRESIQQTGEYVALKSTLTGPKYTISPRTNVLISYG